MNDANAGDEARMLRELTDRNAIRELKARYFRNMDTRQWDAMRDVFTEDAVMDMRDEMAALAKTGMDVNPEAGLIVGRDTIVPTMERALVETRTVHHGHMPEIEFVSENEARGIWPMEDIVTMKDGVSGQGLHGYGHYHETYARDEDGRWRIKHLRLSRLLVDLG